jgi:hypothetical protein
MYQKPVIGIFGASGSGKDLVADWLVEKHDFVKIAYADPMKRMVARLFRVSPDLLWGPSEKRNELFKLSSTAWFEIFASFEEATQEIYDVLGHHEKISGILALRDWLQGLYTHYREEISTRIILQTLGTEWGRAVSESLWSDYATKVIRQVLAGQYYIQGNGHFSKVIDSTYAGVVIPDHRFSNEIENLQKHGGHVLRIRRLGLESKTEEVGIPGHASEVEHKILPDSFFDSVLEFEEGIDKVYTALESWYEKKPWMARTTS